MKVWEYFQNKFSILNGYWWRNFWYQQISSRLRPRNKWLTRHIPRTWADKDTILEICVLESLKHYVDEDGEDAFHVLSTENPPEQAAFMAEVKRYYELATVTLPALQKQIDDEWEKVPHTDWRDINHPCDYEKKYGKIDRLEKELYDLQTKIMVWVVQNRNALWT